MTSNYETFENAEEVWFWFCASIVARADGIRAKGDYAGEPRCCEIGDITRIVKRLKLDGKITNRHLRVMTTWGDLFCPPYYDKRAKRSEIRLWEEGVAALDFEFRQLGIIE